MMEREEGLEGKFLYLSRTTNWCEEMTAKHEKGRLDRHGTRGKLPA